MKVTRKLLTMLVSVAMLAAMLVPGSVLAEGEKIPAIILSVGEGDTTPEFDAGVTQELNITITNKGTADANNVKIVPNMATNTDEWPFEITRVNEEEDLGTLAAGGGSTVTPYKFTPREDVESKYYKLVFTITYEQAGEGEEEAQMFTVEKQVFVKMKAKPKPEPEPEPEPQPGPQQEEQNNSFGGGAGFGSDVYNDSPIATGGGSGESTKSTKIPRVIVTGFSTDPGEVKAGTNFNLIIHLKNTSQSTAVSNMLFDFNAPTEGSDASTSAPAFLPASGSSTIYLDSIPANGAKDIAIGMNAKADLVQKPYSITLSMKYQDGEGTQYEATSNVSVPVKQDARFEFSDFEISPETIAVGEEANIMCSLYNLGRTKLFNVKAKYEGAGISAKEVFVGNVEPGASASIDGMISGDAATTDEGKMKMILSYEDESGKTFSTEKEFTLFVTEMPTDMGMPMDMPMEPEQKQFPLIPLIIAALAVVGIIVGVIVYKKKKKKKLAQEEEGLADEFDRLTEDE